MSSKKLAVNCLLPLVRGQLQQPLLSHVRGSLVGSEVVDLGGNPTCCRLKDPVSRTFASQPSSSEEPTSRSQLDCTKSILKQAQVLQLRQNLDDEAERSLHIPHAQLLRMIVESGAAHNDKEAEEVSQALHRSGVVLRHNDLIFLRPEEIAEKVMQILPGYREKSDQKLQAIDAELKELEQTYKELDREAHKYTNGLLVGGWFVLAFQIGAFYHFTWDELSWDVMEPIAYMISLGYMLIGYSYFLVTKGEVFDLLPFKKFWFDKILKKKALKRKFDHERYLHLTKLKERYIKHLAHAPLRR